MGKKERLYFEITSFNPEVTGSCHLITVHYPNRKKNSFLVDLGLYQEKEYNWMNNEKLPFNSQKLDFILITHNHADHMGRLAIACKEGFTGKIYASKETVEVMPLALNDALSIEKNNAQREKRKPNYEEQEVKMVFDKLEPCEFGEVEYITPNIKVTFFMNGHIYGASMILVQISAQGEEDINLLFTGDYKPTNRLFDVTDMPEWVYELPITIVTESTYGYIDTREIQYHFENDIEEAAKCGKTILISVFAQARAQEVLHTLNEMEYHRKLNYILTGLDGKLAQGYTKVYQKSKLLDNANKANFLLPLNFKYITEENRQMVLNNPKSQIILTTSGMMNHGPAQIYLKQFVERRDVLIYIPGYSAKNTLAYELKNPINGKVRIEGKEYQINAEVKTTSEFSSHAKADEILDLLRKFKKINLVLVNHGECHVKRIFAERIQKEIAKVKRVEILGKHTFVISSNGYVKHMGSKYKIMNDKKVKKAQKKKCKERQMYNKKFTHKRS